MDKKSKTVFDMAHSAESLFIEKQLSHQTKLRKPELDYGTEMEDMTMTTGNSWSPCAGTYMVSKSTDKTSIFRSLWTQRRDEMIDPTQQDFSDAETNNNEAEATTKESQSSEFSNIEESIEAKVLKGMNIDSCVKVSKCIVFSKRDTHCGFQGKIFISNICESYVTYRVSSSNAQKFRYFPDDIGWIAPNSRREIFVQTNRLEAINFEDIASEVFQVQNTTIYRKEQLDMTCLDTLWKAYGTEMFPCERCEVHLIKDVYPKDNDYLENYSLMGRLKLAFFKKMKGIQEPSPTCSECSFYENWPVNSQSYTVMDDQKERTDVVMGIIKEVKESTAILKLKLGYIFFIIFAFVGISGATYSLFYDISDVVDHVSCIFHNCINR